MNNQQLWQAILGHLEISLSKANFNTWFKNTGIAERGQDYILIHIPDMFHKNWISSKYQPEILKALKSLAPEIKEIKYQIGSGSPQNTTSQQKNQTASQKSGKFENPENNQTIPTSGLNPKYTFETFITGKNNELAHAASQAVAKTPGTQYNPLF